MGFLRKHLAWVIVGVAFLAELVALWFVMGKQSQAETARETLEKLREQRDQLKRQVFGIEKRIGIHLERKALVRRELGDCALFLWHQGQAIEGLFDAKELAPYDARPWQKPAQFEVFKLAYDRAYQREVKALEPLMDKVGADPALLGFADTGALAGDRVTIGDIFMMQKDFWIKKRLVEVLASGDAALLAVTLGLKTPGIGARHIAGKALPTGPGKLAEELALQLHFACNYVRLHDLLGSLLRSPLCLRVQSVVNVSRYKFPEPVTPAPTPAAKAPTPKAEPTVKEKGNEGDETAVVQAERREFVGVNLNADLLDLTMDVQEVVFPRAAFADKAKVAEWVEGQLRRVEARLKGVEVPDPTKRPEAGLPWITRETEKLDKAAAPAPGKALPPVDDELYGKREYLFTDVAGARDWLSHRYDFERVKLEAQAELWRRAREALQAGKADEKTHVGVFATDEGMAVGFRPATHFDANEWYEAIFDTLVRDAPVRVKLGLVVFRPELSPEGVKRAVKAGLR